MFKNHTINKNSIYNNFDIFFDNFSYVTKQYKLRKDQARKLWDRQINMDLKKKAFKNLEYGIKLNAYDYLREQFKLG